MNVEGQSQVGERLIRLLMFTVMLSSMSAMMFNIVLPDMSKEFDLSIAQVSWMTSAYFLIYAIGTVTYGKLADRYSLKKLITIGLVLFAAGSLTGLVSQTFWMALVGRCLQSVGASAIPAIAMLIPIRYFSPERRGIALGTVAAGLALGSAVGPVISAVIVSVANWRWLFFVPILILLTLPFYRRYLSDDHQATGKLDWIGGLLLSVAASLLMLGVTNMSLWYAGGCLLSIVLFIVRIRSADEPFVKPALFSRKLYSLGLAMAVLINGIGISLYILSPILLSRVHQLPSYWIGFALVPAALASAALGRKGGRLADSKGNSHLYFLSSVMLMTCFVLLSTFTAVSALWVAVILIIGNVGQTFIQVSMMNFISRTLPKEQTGVGMGIFQLMNFIMIGVSTSVYGKLADARVQSSWNPVQIESTSAVFSNIFLVLAAMHVFLLAIYYFLFRDGRKVR